MQLYWLPSATVDNLWPAVTGPVSWFEYLWRIAAEGRAGVRDMDTKTKKYCGKKIAETLKNILHQLHLGGKQKSKKIIGDEQVRLFIFYVYIIFFHFIICFSQVSLSFSATAPTFYFWSA